jgi:hypothetical protein
MVVELKGLPQEAARLLSWVNGLRCSYATNGKDKIAFLQPFFLSLQHKLSTTLAFTSRYMETSASARLARTVHHNHQ